MFSVALAVALLASPAGRPVWHGQSYGVQIDWREHSLIARPAGRREFELCRFEAVGSDCDSGADYRIISLVGTLLGVRSRLGAYCGGAHPFHTDSLVTVDLRDGKRVRLGDLFSPAAVRAAWPSSLRKRASSPTRDAS